MSITCDKTIQSFSTKPWHKREAIILNTFFIRLAGKNKTKKTYNSRIWTRTNSTDNRGATGSASATLVALTFVHQALNWKIEIEKWDFEVSILCKRRLSHSPWRFHWCPCISLWTALPIYAGRRSELPAQKLFRTGKTTIHKKTYPDGLTASALVVVFVLIKTNVLDDIFNKILKGSIYILMHTQRMSHGVLEAGCGFSTKYTHIIRGEHLEQSVTCVHILVFQEIVSLAKIDNILRRR